MQLCLDKNGNWHSIIDDDCDDLNDFDQQRQTNKIANTLALRTTWLDMLNDAKRNESYERAIDFEIERTVKRVNEKEQISRKDAVVVVFDVGSGTGLLSLIALRSLEKKMNAFEFKVFACEMFLPMQKLSKRIIRDNIVKKQRKDDTDEDNNTITIFAKRSEDVDEIEERSVDVLVSELLDSALIGEGWLLVLRDIYQSKMLMKDDDFCVIPRAAEIFLQIIQCDETVLEDLVNEERSKMFGECIDCDGFSRLDCQVHLTHLIKRGKVKMLLKKPVQVFSIDFTKTNDWLGVQTRAFENVQKMMMMENDDGDFKVNAVCMMWDVNLCSSEDIEVLSTIPKENEPFRRHWRQVIAPLKTPYILKANMNCDSKSTPTLLRIETKITDDSLAFATRISFDDSESVIPLHDDVFNLRPNHKSNNKKDDDADTHFHVCLANFEEFCGSRRSLENICGFNVSKANALLCAKPMMISAEQREPPSGCCFQAFQCNIIDELGTDNPFLWQTQIPIAKKDASKISLNADVGREITCNHLCFFGGNATDDSWKKTKVCVARMPLELTGSRFKIIMSNFDSDEGELIRVFTY